ncbi:MAG: cold shock domain-containing protein [Schleiferiaceae bacterium]|jgi:cold shock CspA family protein|nr:cold shock domain-containing protein [Schleiferiaceae bacterium]
MGRSQETFGKKEKEKKKAQKRKEKLARKEERKANNKKGASLEEMFSYVDENGQLTDTPPDPSKKKKIKAEDIALGVPVREADDDDPIRKGIVDFFNDSKGFGFIRDLDSQEKYFVHINDIEGEIKENNKVSFEIGKNQKGLAAIKVKKA